MELVTNKYFETAFAWLSPFWTLTNASVFLSLFPLQIPNGQRYRYNGKVKTHCNSNHSFLWTLFAHVTRPL